LHSLARGVLMIARRTKVVATLGPASSSPDRIEALILAGMDVARLNFSHGTADEHRERVALVRRLAAEHRRYVGIMGDLQGPKIRIARFAEGKVLLEESATFVLSNRHSREEGTAAVVGIDYPNLVTDCAPGDELLLDDGRVVLRVDEVAHDEVTTTVVVGGELSN